MIASNLLRPPVCLASPQPAPAHLMLQLYQSIQVKHLISSFTNVSVRNMSDAARDEKGCAQRVRG